MFGKKKEEEWEYIGDNYHLNDDGEVEQKNNAEANTDELKELFRPYLDEDEQILWVMGNGNAHAQHPIESEKARKVSNVVKFTMVLFVVGILITMVGNGLIIVIGLLMVVPYFLIGKLGPFVIIALVVIIIIRLVKKGDKNLNYAITDRRIITFAYSYWAELSFNDITDTKVHAGKGNVGRITLKATRFEGNRGNLIFIIPNVYDPYRVKYILDKAIEKFKTDQYQV